MDLQHRPFSPVEETLRKATRLVDEETGVIRLLHAAPIAPDSPKIFGCGSLCSDYSTIGYPADNPVSGSTSMARDQALAGAIGEAVERYSAAYVPYDDIALAPYSTVETDAVAPWTLTLYDADQYARPDFPYRPLAPDDPIGWVRGHSLTTGKQLLVPAFAVYQPYVSHADESPVIQQITTGLACGNTLEEAILSAICEVVERDAAMLMWLQRRQPPRVAVDFAPNSPAALVFKSFGRLQEHVQVFDVTTELEIPAYVAVWDGPIATEQGAIFASCAKPDPQRALVGAVTELAQCLLWAASLIEEKRPVPDPRAESISRIEEHVLWPLRSDNRPLFDFVTASETRIRLEARQDLSSADVLQSIIQCVEAVAAQNMQVIVVDVTAPDIQEAGLHVVRVIVPGIQPLFFGTGLHRISERARKQPGRYSEDERLNLSPHPFP